MTKKLSYYLITIGIAICATIIVIFLEMPVGGRIALFIAQFLMNVGIAILLLDEKEKK